MAHCSTLAVLPDGSLLAAWFSGAFETSRDQAILAARRSRHGGWSPPWIIASAPDHAVGQPVLLPRPGGELWLFFVVIADPEPPPVDPESDMLPPSAAWDSAQPYLQRSYDWGVSWDEPEHLLDYSGLMFRSRPLVLPGRVVVPVYDERKWHSMMLISDDGGRSWWLTKPIVSSPGNIHPCLAPLSDGRLLAYMRTGGEGGRIWRSESTDQGVSWTGPQPTALPNPNSGIDLLRLQSGRLLLAFNSDSTARTPLCVAMAEVGETWQWQQSLEDEKAEFSYPTLLQTDDGLVHLVYTYRREHIHYACFTETWLRKGSINES